MKRQMLLILIPMVILFGSCVSTKRFAQVVTESEVYHDTLKQAEHTIRKQQQTIDSLQKAITKAETEHANQLTAKNNDLANIEKQLASKEEALSELEKVIDIQQRAVYHLKQQVCDALKCFTPEELSVTVKNGKLYVSLSDKLLFPSGSDKVDERGKQAIEQLAEVLKESQMEIMVEGHTDTVPIHNKRSKDNWDLSVHRATSVTRLFTQNGIDPDRVIPAGRSKFLPVAQNTNETGRKLNRRTEIVLAPKLDKLWELTEKENIIEYPEKVSEY